MLPNKITELSFQKIQELLTSGIRESRVLDMKRDAVGTRDDDKREFLADVSSFANSAGGDLIFGVEESNGEAKGFPGIEIEDPDAEICRLESMLRTGIDPRIPGIEIKWLPKQGSTGILFIRIQKSFISPHKLTFRDNSKFYGRNSGGKYAFDVTELRQAFLSANSLPRFIRRFRDERISLIESDESPFQLRSGAKLIMHIIPATSFTTTQDILSQTSNLYLMPLSSNAGCNCKYNIDGRLFYHGSEAQADSNYSYTLLFRSGIIEATNVVGCIGRDGQRIAASNFEWPVLSALNNYIYFLKKAEVGFPIFILFSMINIKGYELVANRQFYPGMPPRQNTIFVPEIQLNDWTNETERTLLPAFNVIWNAFGFERAFTFNQEGQYIGEKY